MLLLTMITVVLLAASESRADTRQLSTKQKAQCDKAMLVPIRPCISAKQHYTLSDSNHLNCSDISCLVHEFDAIKSACPEIETQFLCDFVFPHCDGELTKTLCLEYCYEVFSKCDAATKYLAVCGKLLNWVPIYNDCIPGYKECLDTEFRCIARDSKLISCLPLTAKCNIINECHDNSDEARCTEQCGKSDIVTKIKCEALGVYYSPIENSYLKCNDYNCKDRIFQRIQSDCPNITNEFLCYFVYPRCLDNTVLTPCREYCQEQFLTCVGGKVYMSVCASFPSKAEGPKKCFAGPKTQCYNEEIVPLPRCRKAGPYYTSLDKNHLNCSDFECQMNEFKQIESACPEIETQFLCDFVFPRCDGDLKRTPCLEYCDEVFSKCDAAEKYLAVCSKFLNWVPGYNTCIPGYQECLDTEFRCVARDSRLITCLPLTAKCNIFSQCYDESDEARCNEQCGQSDIVRSSKCEALGVYYSPIKNSYLQCNDLDCKGNMFQRIKSDCPNITNEFLCYFVYPRCLDNTVLTPCREYCQEQFLTCVGGTFYMSVCASFPSKAEGPKKCFAGPKSECIPQPYKFCADEGFDMISTVDRLDTLNERITTFETAVLPLIRKCPTDLAKFFFCSARFPKCHANGDFYLPCYEYCEELRLTCQPHGDETFFDVCPLLSDNDYCYHPRQNTTNISMTIVHNKNCTEDRFKCHRDNACIVREWVCDGHEDCSDGQDEKHCETGRSANEWRCVNQMLIALPQRCDGTPHCSDHSDEINCISLSDDGTLSVKTNQGFFLQVCSAGFNHVTADIACSKLGQRMDVLGWHGYIETTPPDPTFQLDEKGNVSSVLGPGKIVAPCGSRWVVGLKCKRKECGQRELIPTNLMTMADYASPGMWPWMVSLQYLTKHVCSGVIVHEYFILIAAHCVRETNEFDGFKIDIGRSILSAKEGALQRLAIKKRIVHPGYDPHGDRGLHDVALLLLERPINKNMFTYPLCYPDQDDVFTKANECYLTGWAESSCDQRGNLGVSKVLQQRKVTILESHKINSIYLRDESDKITDQNDALFQGFVAAGVKSSSSAVVCKDKYQTFKFVGLVDLKNASCLEKTTFRFEPSLFYLDWLKNVTEDCLFRCDNDRCLYHADLLCDNFDDCGDLSDEMRQCACPFRCDNMRCLNELESLCNNYDDCGDGSDEISPCKVNVTCSFDDPYQCGYIMVRFDWELDANGKGKNNLYPLFDHTLGKDPGKWVTVSRKSYLKSPRVNLTSRHCVRFYYNHRGFTDLDTVIFYDNGQYMKRVFDSHTSVGKQSKDVWRMSSFDVDPGHFQFFVYSYNGAISIDDVWLLEGTCNSLSKKQRKGCFEKEFYCESTKSCHRVRAWCNVIVDCEESHIDEKQCRDPKTKCDFEDGNLCGLIQSDDDNAASEWKIVNTCNTSLNLFDHTFGNSTGHMLRIGTSDMNANNRVTMKQHLYLGPYPYCISFFYASTSRGSLILYTDDSQTRNTLLSFINRPTNSWIQTQVTLPRRKHASSIWLYYIVYGSFEHQTSDMAILLDDISIKHGRCPEFKCPAQTFQCRDEAYCLPMSKVCDGVLDCVKGNDEVLCDCRPDQFKCSKANCISKTKICDRIRDCLNGADEGTVCAKKRSVSCDFESSFMCGYSVKPFKNAFLWKRSKKRFNGALGPKFDHTHGAKGTSRGYYALVEFKKMGVPTSFVSKSFTSYGQGLQFYYYSFYEPLRQSLGRSKLALFSRPESGKKQLLWSDSFSTGKAWKRQCVNLPVGNISVAFQADYGVNGYKKIALDDIQLLTNRCQ